MSRQDHVRQYQVGQASNLSQGSIPGQVARSLIFFLFPCNDNLKNTIYFRVSDYKGVNNMRVSREPGKKILKGQKTSDNKELQEE